MNLSRILVVRLPCKKVYPLGPIYLSAILRRSAPQLSQKLLDLALVRPNQRRSALQEAIRTYQPDIIAFSWRDIQVFAPHDMDYAMRDAFLFFHDPSPLGRIGAAFKGLGHIFTYRSRIADNLDLIRGAVRFSPGSTVAVGGPAIRIFGERFRRKLPPEVHLFPETTLDGFFQLLSLPLPKDSIEPELDLESLEAVFPEWSAYAGEEIGIQTKQGCPHRCLYCLYGFLEGKKVRRRDPARVVNEIAAYSRRWGARRFWFADAQLLSEPSDYDHLSAILEGLIRERLDLNWSGYLRVNDLSGELAGLMVRSGLHELEISLNSGAQSVLDQLRLDFSVEEVIKGCEVLQKAGYPGRVLVNLSLNAPGETRETLAETLRVMGRIRTIFGDDRVIPVMFFLAIQPHTGLERKALKDGSIRETYDPLSPFPWAVRRLIHNPPPLDKLIGRCCARAFHRPDENAGGRILECLEQELKKR
jgi:hypothetical protein